MASHHITQLDINKFEISGSGVPKRLTFLGDSEWLLAIGVNTVENMKNGRFTTIKYNSLDRLEAQFPEWKGIALIFNSACPHTKAQAFH